MKCTFKILFFCIAFSNKLFAASSEPMSPDAIIEQAVSLGYVPVTDLTDEQLQTIAAESKQRLAQAKGQEEKKIENAGGLGLEA